MQKVSCTNCNIPIFLKPSRIKKANKVYCSIACRSQFSYLSFHEEKDCAFCNTRFTSLKSRKAKYCSRQCLYASNVIRKQKSCILCSSVFTVIPSQEKRRTVKFCSKTCANLGTKKIEEKKCSNLLCSTLIQRRPSEFTGEFQFCSRSCRTGQFAPAWDGGKTADHLLVRNSKEYALWRRSVFERDNFSCVECGDNSGGNLEADHIKPFAFFPELRLDIKNGRTLCKNCHKKTDTYGSRCYSSKMTPQRVV